MHIAIKSLGIIITLLGVAYLLKPGLLKLFMNFFKQDNRIYLPGLLRLALAVIFFFSAHECKYPLVIYVSGILFLAGAILIFSLGPQRIRWIFNWYEEQPALIFRVIGLIVIIFGSIIIISV